MIRHVRHILGLLLIMLVTQVAFAQTLQEAKQQGLVGEQRDGYIGLVQSDVSAELRELVQQVNEERRRRYQQIAEENGITLAQVTAVAYERAVEATERGHYIQLPNGEWVRK